MNNTDGRVVVLKTLTADDWEQWRTVRLAALREAPYAFHSTLADWQDADESRWRQRLDGGSLNLVAECDGSPAGMASGMPSGHEATVNLMSMWVAPFARGRGVGDALVMAVLRWAEERGARHVVLGVVEGNHHAVALYRRHGFVDNGRIGPERQMIRHNG